MLNFTVGPVQSDDTILEIGKNQVPYFRTEDFSKLMLDNEKLIKKLVNAPNSYRTVFITGSGTASMEAAVINTLTPDDKVLIINGGNFGQRFIDICNVHNIKNTEIKLQYGEQISKKILSKYDNKGYSAFIVNMHETTTGILYNMKVISDFCKKNNMFLIVDAISSFLADEFDMKKYNVDVMVSASQKALACPPGISLIVLSDRAIEKVYKSKIRSYYLDLKKALFDGERGQTPFTPSVSILIQINARLNKIMLNGGVSNEIERVHNLALDFRNRIKGLPFEIPTIELSNAITPLKPLTKSAYEIFMILKNEYGIWVCPNGSELKDKIFRVGHIGNLTIEDNKKLIDSLKDMKKRKII